MAQTDRAPYNYSSMGRTPRKSKITMAKSKIWHYPNEEPATRDVDIYLLNSDNDIFLMKYDEISSIWSSLCEYCRFFEFVAWAYVDDIVNL